MMYVYENEKKIRTIPVSTGAPTSKTFTPSWRGTVGKDWGSGTFPVDNLLADHIWYLFPGPEGSILIHSVPYSLDGEIKRYDQVEALGIKPVSRGCVRISTTDADWLKNWNPVGVAIEITRWSGKIIQVKEEAER